MTSSYLHKFALTLFIALAANYFLPAYCVDMVLLDHLHNESTNVIKLSSSMAQFLQTGGRWFPQPQGDDGKLVDQIHDLRQSVDQMSSDVQSEQPNMVLESDLDQIQRGRNRIRDLLPAVGGNQEVADDWSLVDAGVDSIDQSFKDSKSSTCRQTAQEVKPASLADCLAKLIDETSEFRTALGGFVNSTNRITPEHDEDLQLVHLLKDFQLATMKLKEDAERAQEPAILEDDLSKVTYTASKMDPLPDLIGASEDVRCGWQQIQSTLNTIAQLIAAGQDDHSRINPPRFP